MSLHHTVGAEASFFFVVEKQLSFVPLQGYRQNPGFWTKKLQLFSTHDRGRKLRLFGWLAWITVNHYMGLNGGWDHWRPREGPLKGR